MARKSCRLLWIFALTFLAEGQSVSQPVTDSTFAAAFFPLHIGNRWDYFDYHAWGGGIADTVIHEVVRDTTISGSRYSIVHVDSRHYGYHQTIFTRIDHNGNVLKRTAEDSVDRLRYRLSDISPSLWSDNGRLLRFDSLRSRLLFGQSRRTLTVFTYNTADTIHPMQAEGLAEGIGYLGFGGPEGGGPELEGARINGVVFGTLTHVGNDTELIPTIADLRLFPNPFNSHLTIEVISTSRIEARVTVHSLLGQEIALIGSGTLSPGRNVFHWAPSSAATGVYYVSISQPHHRLTKRIALLK